MDMNLESMIATRLAEMGFELVDLQCVGSPGGKRVLIRADREGGITVGDCQSISRELGPLLEDEQWSLGSFNLEVSSPGLDRPLKKLQDVQRFVGKKAAIKTKTAQDGRRHYKGYLSRVQGNAIVMQIDEREFEIDWDDVLKAHLVFEG